MKYALAFALVALAPASAHAEPEEAVAPPAPLAIPHHRLVLALELFTDADWISRSGPDLTQFQLDRGEAGATVGLGPNAGAELRLESVRSAANGGVLGIDGDSLVVRVKRAQLFGDYHACGVRWYGAIGMTPDLWIASLEQDYTPRPLSPTASERMLGWQPSDLALIAGAELGPARLSVSVGNGEGLTYPERNTGKTTTAVLDVAALATSSAKLRVLALVKDGSLGPASVRDQRVGGGATFTSAPASAGFELVRAWGVDEVGPTTAWVAGGWLEARPIEYGALIARAATIGYGSGGRSTSAGGAIAVEPWRDDTTGGRLRLWLALDRTTSSGTAMPLPGADPGNATTLMLIASTTAPFVLD